MRLIRILPSLVLVCLSSSPLAFGQDSDDPAFKPKVVKVKRPDNQGLIFYGGTGVAVFQDIQVPVNEVTETRGDGTLIAEENQDHLGLPLFAGIGYRQKVGSVTYDYATFEGTKIRSTAGPAATQSSSYTRLELQSGARYKFRLGFSESFAAMHLGLRKSLFSNIANAHFVESAIVRPSLGLQRGAFGLTGFLGYAPISRVGYSSTGVGGGEYFKKSSATVFEMGLNSAWALSSNSYLDLGLEQEAISMRIDDIMEYNGFGLNVSPARQNSREYNLSTYMFKAGFRKLF